MIRNKVGPRGRGSAQGSASVSKASDSFATSTWGVAFTWTRIWSKNSRSLWNERNFSADPHKSPLSSTRRRGTENLLISFLARAPPPPARQEMLAISIHSTAWAPMLAPSRSAVHASRNPVIHVRMSTYPAPEGFAWSSEPELAPGPPPISTATVAVAGSPSDSSSWGPAPAAPAVVPAAAEKKPAAEKKRKPATQGIFAPLVTGAKALMGEEELNKLRGEVIAQHSKVISAFVDTSESPFGQLVIRKMFEAADKDGSGGVDKEELRAALKALGFDFLEEKQVSGILERADTSGDLVIDFEEFVKETPRCAHHRRNPHRLSRPPPRRDRPPFCVNRLTGCVVARFAP